MGKFNISDTLKARIQEVTASGLPFMDGKDKVDFADGETYVVKEYGYLEGADDQGVVKEFVVVSDGKTFGYGGSIVTQAFKGLDDVLTSDEIIQVLNEGLPMTIGKKKSAKGRKYTTCKFFN